MTLVLCLLPLWFAAYPPAADLPQHVAQVARSMEGGLPQGQYVAWWAPNNLVYLPMMALWKLIGAQQVASGTLIVLGLLWTSACFALAYLKGRSPAAAALASLCFYNGILYWGMVNFLIAWPIFVLWWIQFDRCLTNNKYSLPSFAFLVLSTLLLVWAHVLAFAAAGILSGGLCLLHLKHSGWKRCVLTLSTFFPAAAWTIPWVLQLSSARAHSGFEVGAYFTQGFFPRLHYLLGESVATGGPLPVLLGLVVLLWILSGLAFRRRADPGTSDEQLWQPDLLMIGLAALAAGFFLPDKYLNTIQFANRWFPWAVAFLCLATPGPKLTHSLRHALVLLVVLSFSLVATSRFRHFARNDLFGFEQALARIPSQSRVLELDYIKISPTFPNSRPFLHLSSYATVFRQTTTHFDFGRHGTGLIRGSYAPTPWTPGIEWAAEWARPHDLLHFDYVLVGAPAELHGRFPLAQWLVPITYSGVWRLYEVPIAPRSGFHRPTG